MRTLAFDGRVGASGDLLLGALLAAGADRARLEPVEAGLPVHYEISETTDQGLTAIDVDVRLDGDDEHTAEGHGTHRSYAAVLEILEELAIPATVREDAQAIVRLLAEAEASVHGTTVEEVAFHEVGADDAIADIVGVALLIDDLAVDRILTTPVAAGDGEVEMSHGIYPAPGPAVTAIAETADWDLQGGPVEHELLTPTGAAILAHYATGVQTLPAMDVRATGYGAGDYDLGERPNVLKAMVGSTDENLRADTIRVLETTVDDVSPEILGDLQESLLAAGAKDVSIVPTTMKKSRPGHLIKVIAKPDDVPAVARRLAEETGTLGIRDSGVTHRWIADRTIETATLTIEGTTYTIDVKLGQAPETGIYDVSAEYDDVAVVARETSRPLREIRRRAEQQVREQHDLS